MRLAFVPLVFLLFVVALVLSFSINIFGSAEVAANMTENSTYIEEYEAVTNLEHAFTSEVQVIGFLVVLGGVLILGYIFLR